MVTAPRISSQNVPLLRTKLHSFSLTNHHRMMCHIMLVVARLA